MIAQGFGWNSLALPAAALSFLAMSALLIYGCQQRRQAYERRLLTPGFAQGKHQAVGPGEKGRGLQQIQLGQSI